MRGFALFLFLASPSFAALSGATLEEAIQGIISQRHPTDTRETWVGLGPEAPAMVQRMYGRSDRPTEKARLLQGLGWFTDASSVEFLKEQARNADLAMVRESAIRSIGRSAGSGGTDFVAGYLTHPTPSTRIAAARTLQGIRERNPSDAHAEAMLKKFEADEKVAWVRARGKGDALPESTGVMTPVARSGGEREDPASRMRAKWEGEWSGFLVISGAKGPASEAVRVKLSSGRAEGWRGTGKEAKAFQGSYEIAPDGTTAKLKLDAWEGKAALFGTLRFEDERLKWDGSASVGIFRKRSSP